MTRRTTGGRSRVDRRPAPRWTSFSSGAASPSSTWSAGREAPRSWAPTPRATMPRWSGSCSTRRCTRCAKRPRSRAWARIARWSARRAASAASAASRPTRWGRLPPRVVRQVAERDLVIDPESAARTPSVVRAPNGVIKDIGEIGPRAALRPGQHPRTDDVIAESGPGHAPVHGAGCVREDDQLGGQALCDPRRRHACNRRSRRTACV